MANATQFTIPAELKEKWLEALRSGQYAQCTGILMENVAPLDSEEFVPGYCCLGVLQMVADGEVEHNAHNEIHGLPSGNWYNNHGINFPNRYALDTAGDSPTVMYNGVTTTLSALNDDHKLTFAQIADLIEEQAVAV
jgi:hypothetical protein